MSATAAVYVDGRRTGSAVLVDPYHLLTARHVVTDGIKAQSVSLAVVMPAVSDWHHPTEIVAVGFAASDDVAVLRLATAVDTVGPVRLSASRRMPDSVNLFGFPGAERDISGVWRELSQAGPTAAGLIQLRWDEDAGSLKGQSGGPVVDARNGELVGLITAGSTPGKFDRIAPLTMVERTWPELLRPWLFAGADARGHVTRRALGQRGGLQQDLFQGRRAALARVARFVHSDQAAGRPLVITGQPGAGKSAVIGRSALFAEESRLGPGLIYHARGASHEHFLDSVAEVVGLGNPSSGDVLLTEMDGLREQRRFVLFVDALDEAVSSTARRAIAQTCSDLASRPWARVVVATRAMATSDRFAPEGLLRLLRVASTDAPTLVDLDDASYLDEVAVEAFVRALLLKEDAAGLAWERYRNDPKLCSDVSRMVAIRARGNFLVAALTATALVGQESAELDRSPPTLNSLPSSVEEALGKFLNGLDEQRRLHARGLLVALSFARGEGFSDHTWLGVAAALGYVGSQVDLDGFRSSGAADYLVQTIPGLEAPLTRLFHQALIDQLQTGQTRERQAAVFEALRHDSAERSSFERVAYNRMYLAAHAAAAGHLEPLLRRDAQFLAHCDFRNMWTALSESDADTSQIASVIRRAGGAAATLSPQRRLWLLALTAAHLGLSDIHDDLASSLTGGITPVWAQSLGRFHRRLGGNAVRVNDISLGRLNGQDVILFGGHDAARIWDDNGVALMDPLKGHRSSVLRVAIVGVGNEARLVTGGSDYAVQFWDHRGAPLGSPVMLSGRVTTLAMGFLDGRPVLAASGGSTGVVCGLDGSVICGPFVGADSGRVTAMGVGRLGDKEVIATAGKNGYPQLWNPDGSPLGGPLVARGPAIHDLAMGVLGGQDVLMTAGEDGYLRSWGLTGPASEPFRGHAAPIRSVALGNWRGETVVVSGSTDRTIRIWDAAGRLVEEPLIGHNGPVNVVEIGHHNGRDVIVSGGHDETLRLWEAEEASTALTGHEDHVHDIATSRSNDRVLIASASRDRTVRLWDEHGRPVGEPLRGQSGAVFSVAFDHPSRATCVLAGGQDRVLSAWRLDGRPLQPLVATNRSVANHLATGIIEDGTVLVSGGADQVTRIWDLPSRASRRLAGHTRAIYALCVGSLGNTGVIASGGSDEFVLLRDLRGKMLRRLVTGASRTTALAIGRVGDDEVVVAGDVTGQLRIWDRAGKLIACTPKAHRRAVTGLAIMRVGDVDVIVSASMDGTLGFWDSHGYELEDRYTMLEPIAALAIHPEGLVVASGRAVASIRVDRTHSLGPLDLP